MMLHSAAPQWEEAIRKHISQQGDGAGWVLPLCFPGTFELSKQHGENPHNLGGQQPPIAARKERHTAHKATSAASSLVTAAPLEKVTTLQAVVLFCAL